MPCNGAGRRRADRRLQEQRRRNRGGDREQRNSYGREAERTAAAEAVGLFQTGIVSKLPDPPLRVFDSSRVDASAYAFRRLRTPDAFLMLLSYAVTAWTAAAGGKNRAHDEPLLPIAMGAKTLYDVATTLRLAREEWRENEALCAYCQAATAVSLVSALALPEAMQAVRSLAAPRTALGRLAVAS